MLIHSDYHMHSVNSGDARDTIPAMCERAIELGLTEIAFTEHVDFEPTDMCYGVFKYPEYIEEIIAAREEFAGRLTIRAGVECDFQEKYRDQIETVLADKEALDYVLGAVHYIDGRILEHHQTYFPGKNEREAYEPYFKTVKKAAESGYFDAIAHMDLCKRYGCLYYGELKVDNYRDLIEDALAAMIDHAVALEINTSGLRQAPEETYPSAEVVNMYAALGGKFVVIGSDAHKTEDLGKGIDVAAKIASEAGLVKATFTDRRLRPVLLDRAGREETSDVAASSS